MLRNSFNSQLVSNLNLDVIYQTHYLPQNASKKRRPMERLSIFERSSIKSEDKKQYLSLVSKSKKPQKRTLLKSNKNDSSKKINSVILGGEKKWNTSFANTQKLLRSSLCRSCINLHQRGKKIGQSTQKYNLLHVQPVIQPASINMKPQCPNTVQNNYIEQLNQIISQKLNLTNIQPDEKFVKINNPDNGKNQNISRRFEGKMIRNTSSAGRIYFSVGNSLEKQNQTPQEQGKFTFTPRFDKTSEQKQKKTRKNAGFIRSASAPRISYESSAASSQNQFLNPFEISSDMNSKQLEINRCIEKMSSIRKEIDDLQDFLQERLLSSELKNKFMYNPKLMTQKSFSIPEKEVSFSTINVDSRLQERDSIYTPMNSLNLMKTQQNESKPALMEIKSSFLNSSWASKMPNNFYSKNQKLAKPQSLAKLQSLYEAKCPIQSYNSNLQKQIINQIASKFMLTSKQNQQNIFYYKHPINSLR